MKKLFLLLLILSPQTALADQTPLCERHPIYCKIVELRPSINKTFAMEVSNYIYAASRHYGTDPMLSVAIAMQESSWRNIDRKETILDSKGNYVRGVSDIGLFQLHVETIKNFDIDAQRLRSDVEYQVWEHVKLLKRKITVCKSKGWATGHEWACYHSYTPRHRNNYKKLVRRFL